jgi:endonuclease YncB( thermonuclease family)
MKKRMALGIFLILIFTSSAVSGAQTPALPEVRTYDQLVAAIRQTRAASRARVEQAVRQEKVRACWETGRLIDAHVLQRKERADYGENILERLSADLGTSRTELSYMLQFARAYPVLRTSEDLTWSHYESLLALNDDKEREEVRALASKEKWPLQKLREEVKKRKAAKGETPAPAQEAPLTAKPGKPGTYRMVKAAVGPETGKVVIDLGFSNYYRTSKDLRFKEGAIIEVIPAFPGAGSTPSDKIKLSKRATADLYTYRAWVFRVLDGDTIEAVVDLGFGVRSVQTLRLRGIDAPELVSKEGKEAKAALEEMLKLQDGGGRMADGETSGPVLIRTVKSDKYDRYLADIFYADKNGKQEYLNSRLLEAGHAVRVRK